MKQFPKSRGAVKRPQRHRPEILDSFRNNSEKPIALASASLGIFGDHFRVNFRKSTPENLCQSYPLLPFLNVFAANSTEEQSHCKCHIYELLRVHKLLITSHVSANCILLMFPYILIVPNLTLCITIICCYFFVSGYCQFYFRTSCMLVITISVLISK